MKKMKRLLLFAAISAMIFGIFVKCGSQQEKVFVNPDFARYVSAYTSGIISKKATITIELAKDVAGITAIGESVDKDLFDFEPAIKGKAVWASTNVIEFEPDEDLEPGQRYTVDLDVKQLMEVDKGFENFQFSFDVIEPNFNVSFDEIQTIDRSSLKWQKLVGLLECADVESVESVSKLMKAKHSGKSVKVKWEETGDPLKFRFTVDSIERTLDATDLQVEWNGASWNVDKKGEEVFAIPSIDNFMFLSARVENQPDQRLVLQFSDPLDENQVLNGMIEIDRVAAPRFIIAGNQIFVYPPNRISDARTIKINAGLKNSLGYKVKENHEVNVTFENVKPQLRTVTNGVIMPSAQGLMFPFEAVGLKEVDVRVFRIYSQNVPQFLQTNNMRGNSQLYRVGKSMAKKSVSLEKYQNDLGQWNRYFLDLNDIIKPEPGAIYNVSIGFRKHQAYSVCEVDEEEETEDEPIANINKSWRSLGERDQSYWNYYDDYYYSWEHRNDPCHKAYYGQRHSISQNVLSSNLGIIAKKGRAGQIVAYITDLLQGTPVEGVEVSVLDFQQISVYKGKTDANGKVSADLPADADPYFIVAKRGDERAYLRLADGNVLSTSMFNVSGVDVKNGLKAFIFGERGVWRPGDSLYVSVIVEDQDMKAEDKPPVVLEFTNPKGQLFDRKVVQRIDDDFYTFRLKTSPKDITGDWNVKVMIGAAEFHKTLKIETIKPNRLKINFDFGKDALAKGEPAEAVLNVKWLHGAPARELAAKVDVSVYPVPTKFDTYTDFIFDDKTKSISSSFENIFDDKIDSEGNADISATLEVGRGAPGMLRASFMTKVFEKSGDFSIDNYSLPYHPFEEYIGLMMPKGDKSRNMLLTDTTHSVSLVIVDKDGKNVTGERTVEVSLYKLSWKWWWDNTSNDVSNYSYSSYSNSVVNETVTVKNGKGKWDFKVKYPQWGRFLAVVKNLKTGHSASKVVYIDWPGWAGKSREGQGSMASMLTLNTDKEDYSVGEKINLTIPSPANGRALISIENGSELVKEFWVETKKGETNISIDATEDMLPNAYIHTMMLQPHGQKENDLPMRLYGIKNVNVVDQKTKLQPVLKVADAIAPESRVSFQVSEKDGREMSYVVAVVDEGLLDLTRFKTPDPWSSFYAKEALGVKTWDLYDWVIGAHNGKLERILKVGGGFEGEGEEESKNNLRFKPVVKFFGPFKLKKGKKTHTFKMPMYIGSVKFMVIARDGENYGHTEKAVPVKKPVMLLASLPRVLNPGDKISLPVTIFSMDDKKRDVNVTVSNKGLVDIPQKKQTIGFTSSGDKTIMFEGTVGNKTGVEHFEVVAKSGKDVARYIIDIEVRSPNPEIAMVESSIVEAGNNWETSFDMFGLEGTNEASLEISTVPPVDLGKRLQYLIKYPHGCIEQTTSSVFPQLALHNVVELKSEEKKKIANNINAGIDRLKSFQLPSGGFTYWPGRTDAVSWGTNYAGHFLVEAKERGYSVPRSMIKSWIKYQQKAASDWSSSNRAEQLIQAYRLYTLALAGKPHYSAMNRMKQSGNLSSKAQWRLAAAYAVSGKEQMAKQMISGLDVDKNPVSQDMFNYTYGSVERDQAMVLETLSILGLQTEAFKLVEIVSDNLSDNKKWMSTQSVAYSLLAVSKFVGKYSSSNTVVGEVVLNGKTVKVSSNKPIFKSDLDIKAKGNTLKVVNSSKTIIYARLVKRGVPMKADIEAQSESISLAVDYYDFDGSLVNPSELEQGTDFLAKVTVRNTAGRTLTNIALTHYVPSGWEIINTRLFDVPNLSSASTFDYQDIRDDKVLTYFDLYSGSSRTFYVVLNASYQGEFMLPVIKAEAMYDNKVNAVHPGGMVKILSSSEIEN